jgi:hypothetical protein
MAQRRPAHGRPAGIDEGCTGIDGGRNTEHLTDLYPRSAVTRRRFGVHGDTAVVPDGDGDRERDQFTGLRPEQICVLASGGQGLIALDRVGVKLGNSPIRTLSC